MGVRLKVGGNKTEEGCVASPTSPSYTKYLRLYADAFVKLHFWFFMVEEPWRVIPGPL